MCLVYALYLWWKYGGYLVFVFQPAPHALVFSKHGVWHGTNKSGKWRIEYMDRASVTRWLFHR